MAGFKGSKIAVVWDSINIAAREKSLTVNGEAVDVSDDSSGGWRELLDEPGEMTVDISLSGVTKSHELRHAVGDQGALTYTYPATQGSLNGNFQLVSYTETGNYKDTVTFDAELQSTGEVTFTAPL